MHPALKLNLDGFEFRNHWLLRSDPPYGEGSTLVALPRVVGEPQEVEGFWFSLSTQLPVASGEPPELDQSHGSGAGPRGIRRSSKPADGYDKKTQAKDMHAVVTSLGYDKTVVAAHDIGNMVASSKEDSCNLTRTQSHVERTNSLRMRDGSRVLPASIEPISTTMSKRDPFTSLATLQIMELARLSASFQRSSRIERCGPDFSANKAGSPQGVVSSS